MLTQLLHRPVTGARQSVLQDQHNSTCCCSIVFAIKLLAFVSCSLSISHHTVTFLCQFIYIPATPQKPCIEQFLFCCHLFVEQTRSRNKLISLSSFKQTFKAKRSHSLLICLSSTALLCYVVLPLCKVHERCTEILLQ